MTKLVPAEAQDYSRMTAMVTGFWVTQIVRRQLPSTWQTISRKVSTLRTRSPPRNLAIWTLPGA